MWKLYSWPADQPGDVPAKRVLPVQLLAGTGCKHTRTCAALCWIDVLGMWSCRFSREIRRVLVEKWPGKACATAGHSTYRLPRMVSIYKQPCFCTASAQRILTANSIVKANDQSGRGCHNAVQYTF